jgi:hypothetical protein
MGGPRLQYLKQVARNVGADSFTYSSGKNGLQQIQMKSCQPIKRLKIEEEEEEEEDALCMLNK